MKSKQGVYLSNLLKTILIDKMTVIHQMLSSLGQSPCVTLAKYLLLINLLVILSKKCHNVCYLQIEYRNQIKDVDKLDDKVMLCSDQF